MEIKTNSTDILRQVIIREMESGSYMVRPCPFCGKSEMDFTGVDSFQELSEDDGKACIRMSCKNCNIDMYDHTYAERNYQVRKFLLITKWNMRAEVQI